MIDIHSHIVFDVDDGPKTEKIRVPYWKKAILIKELRTVISLLSVVAGDVWNSREENFWKFSRNWKKLLTKESRRFNRLLQGEVAYQEMMSWKTRAIILV